MTRDLWCEAFTRAIGRVDQGLDDKRIESAFLKFEEKAIKWPSPAMVIELMPRRPEVERITFEPAPTATGKAYMAVALKVIEGELTQEQAVEEMNKIKGASDEMS